MTEEKEIVYDLNKTLQNFISPEMPIHIEVSKNTKGYNYSVSLYGKEMADCIDTVMKAMDILKEKFQ
jgi:hypothetical protein